MNFLGFGQSADIDIVFDGADNRKMAEIKTDDGKKEKYLLYLDGETVSGKVNVTLKKPGTKLEHHGIKIELIGQIELYFDRGNRHEFLSHLKELARHGDLIKNTSYPFEFPNVEKPYEVYVGSNVRLRYFLRVTIVRRISDIIREVDIAVHTLSCYPEINSPIKMEVGIEDCLHIEFEYNKSKYHLKDVIVGKIYFLLVRIKIKHMEIAIIKREMTGTGSTLFTENETIAKYEIMDGAPVKGESIPIRVFLAGYDLTPTMREVHKKFSVRYFLNLVLMDTEDRRYFKQQEITLWRKSDKARKSISNNAAAVNAAVSQNANQNASLPSHLVDTTTINHVNQTSLLPDGTISSMMSSGSGLPPPSISDPLTPSSNTGDQTMGLFTEEVESSQNKVASPFDTNNTSSRSSNPLLFDDEDDDDIMSSAQSSNKSQQPAPTAQSQQKQEQQTATSSLFDSPVEATTPIHSNNNESTSGSNTDKVESDVATSTEAAPAQAN